MKHKIYQFLIVIIAINFTFIPFSKAQTYPKTVLKDMDTHCRAEWTKRGELDKRMYDYCIKQEKEGYDEMLYIIEKNKNYEWLQDLKSDIIIKWTKAGVTQWRMVGYALEQELDAYLDLQYGLSHGEFNKADYNVCYTKWRESKPADVWGMTLHCLKK